MPNPTTHFLKSAASAVSDCSDNISHNNYR